MEDEITPLDEFADDVEIGNVAGDHLHAARQRRLVEPVPAAERVVVDQRPHRRARLDQPLGQVAADEAARARDQDLLAAEAQAANLPVLTSCTAFS